MERQSQPQHNGVVELAGVRYQQQPDGTWAPMRQVEQRVPQAATIERRDGMSDTAYHIQDIEKLRSVVAAADVAREDLDRKAAAAAELLAKREAALAARTARTDRQRQLDEFYNWEPAAVQSVEERAVASDWEPVSVARAVGPYETVRPVEEIIAEAAVPKRKKLRKGMAIAALGGVLLSGAGGAVAVTGYPMKWFAGEQKAAAANVSQVPLSAAKEQLIDAFGGCFDEQGNGAPLATADVQTTTDVSYQMTTADNKQVLLTAADKSTGRTSIKPIVKLTDAKADYTACVVAADRGDVVKIDGNTIEVNESLISPQGHVAIASYLRGMMLNESDNSTALDTTSLVAQLVNAKTISAAEGKRVTDAYAADATAKEEVRLAGALTAKELANDSDIYAQQAKARIDAAIKQAINTRVKQLHDQGAISVDAANVVITGALSRPITMKNNDPTPAANMPFAETGAPRVLNYAFKTGGTN